MGIGLLLEMVFLFNFYSFCFAPVNKHLWRGTKSYRRKGEGTQVSTKVVVNTADSC